MWVCVGVGVWVGVCVCVGGWGSGKYHKLHRTCIRFCNPHPTLPGAGSCWVYNFKLSLGNGNSNFSLSDVKH